MSKDDILNRVNGSWDNWDEAEIKRELGGIREPVVHHLKCWPVHFEELWSYRKTFELRLNDRDYHVGDKLHLQEWDKGTGKYSGREMWFTVTHLLKIIRRVNCDNEEFVIMSLGTCGDNFTPEG